MFKTDTFKGGIHPLRRIHEGKGYTESLPTRFLPPPGRVIIPMSQSAGTTCDPLVAKGDHVLLGQKIGEPRGFVGAPVHATVSGKVLIVEQREISAGTFCQCVIVENDGLDERADPLMPVPLSAEQRQIVDAIRAAGLVGLGGAVFPTHIKLAPPSGKTVDTVILDGAECEPFLNSDHRVMLEMGQKVIDGLKYAMRALNAPRGIIAIEKNKPLAIAHMQELVQQEAHIEVRPLKVKYPQGSEKQLIQATTSRQVPSGGLPADAGCVVLNVSTCAAIADALMDGKPLYERVVTVSGSVANPANLLVRFGTPISALIEACGGLLPETRRVLAGAPMMGVALFDLEAPTIKSTSGVTALTNAQVDPTPGTACIRCGRCARGCPIRLLPMKLREASIRQDWQAAQKLHAFDCLECGTCSYSCPAKLELVSNIRVAKRTLIAQRKR